MADKRQSPIPKTWRRRSAVIAVLTGLIVAVYVTLDEQGNKTGDPACSGAVANAATLDPLIGGEIAAFRIAKEGDKLSDLAFTDVDGQPTTLAAYQGQVSLVNLWATWCGPCRAEMPTLDRLEGALGGEDFSVVPISVDRAGSGRPEQFMQSVGVEHLPLLTDPTTKIFDEMKGRGLAVGLPVTVLLDRDGCRLGSINGPAEWDSDDGRRLIEAAIKFGAGD